MTTTTRLATACAAAVLALALTACGGSTDEPSSPAAPTSSSGSSGGSTGAKVSANTASEEEIAAALERAGVSSPEKWAEEVVEYRPYPADDPKLSTLRESLEKYNPGKETTDKIVSVLTP